MALREQDVDRLYVVDVSVFLKLLPYFRADLGDGHVQGVHGLDLGTSSQPFSVGFQDSAPRIRPID